VVENDYLCIINLKTINTMKILTTYQKDVIQSAIEQLNEIYCNVAELEDGILNENASKERKEVLTAIDNAARNLEGINLEIEEQ
jgi:hypothetical protein